MTQSDALVPTLSLAEDGALTFVEDLRQALSETGFVALRHHALPQELQAAAFEQAAALFSRTEEQKCADQRPEIGGQRGFTPFGREVAQGRSQPDLKEFWHVGRERILPELSDLVDPAAAAAALAQLPPNVWPAELPDFRAATLGLYRSLERIALRLLSAVALGLGLSEDFFDENVAVGDSVLRLLHYPPLPAEQSVAVRAAAHGDINLITLLIGAREPGLQVLNKSGQWIDAPSGDDLILCNVGDMLERLTNGCLRSTTHRVVNPPAPWSEQSRYSAPFFVHLNTDFLIRTLPECVSEAQPDLFPESITAGAFLQQRLRAIGML